jgi:hypothetical protein
LGDDFGRFVAVELDGIETRDRDYVDDLLRRVIYEHTYFRYLRRNRLFDLAGKLRLDKTPTFAKEIKAERVGACRAGRASVCEIRDATDLDAKHCFIIRRRSSAGLA